MGGDTICVPRPTSVSIITTRGQFFIVGFVQPVREQGAYTAATKAKKKKHRICLFIFSRGLARSLFLYRVTAFTRLRVSTRKKQALFAENKFRSVHALSASHIPRKSAAALFVLSLPRGCIRRTFRLCYSYYFNSGTTNASNGRSCEHPTNTEVSFGRHPFPFANQGKELNSVSRV